MGRDFKAGTKYPVHLGKTGALETPTSYITIDRNDME